MATSTKTDITLHWAECALLRTVVVGNTVFSRERIASDRAGKILNTLDASGWQQDDDNVLSVSYANYRAFIWQNEQGSWSFSVATITGDPIAGEYVNNISEVKRETASALADLFNSDYLVPPCFLFPCASTMGMACTIHSAPTSSVNEHFNYGAC